MGAKDETLSQAEKELLIRNAVRPGRITIRYPGFRGEPSELPLAPKRPKTIPLAAPQREKNPLDMFSESVSSLETALKAYRQNATPENREELARRGALLHRLWCRYFSLAPERKPR